METRKLACVTLLFLACGGEVAPASSPAPSSSANVAARLASAAPAKTTVKRTIVMALTRVSGSESITTSSDGSISVAVDIKENGRGPHVDATLRLASDGSIATLDAKGHHTMGTLIAESFSRDARHARWKSLEETGERDVEGSAFFVPIAPIPSAIGWLAEALVKAGGSMPLLPSGTARIEKTVATTVKVAGKERSLVGHAITGLHLTPSHVWLNEDGSWFGCVSEDFSLVPAGWESAIEPLLEKQNDVDRARDATLAAKTAHKPPASGVAFTHARMLDVERGRWVPDTTVVVIGDTITAVGPSAAVKPPSGAEVVDLSGKAILPGLWDMHAHLADADGVLDVASGVTTARDVGNDPDKLDDYKKRFDTGAAVGPHVLRFGFIEGRNENAAASKVTAENEAEAKAAVELFAKRGYEGIKIYNSVRPELVPLLAKEAHARGMMVSGHIPVHMLANEAVRAGYDGIEHINMLFLNFFADHDTDTRTPLRFSLVGDKAASFDLASKPVSDFLALLADRRTLIDPTLGAFEELLVGQQGKVVPGLEAMVARLPVQTQRTYLLGGLPLGDKAPIYRASFEKLLAMVKLLHEKKVPLVVGTDMLAGLSLHHELALYVRAGIPPAVAIRMATLDSARAMKRDTKTGSIAPGKAADLFIVRGDPLLRIEDIVDVSTTVRGGVVFDARPLYESVGVQATK